MFSYQLGKRNYLVIGIVKYLMMSAIGGPGGGNGPGRGASTDRGSPSSHQVTWEATVEACAAPHPALRLPGVGRAAKQAQALWVALGARHTPAVCEKPSVCPAAPKILNI